LGQGRFGVLGVLRLRKPGGIEAWFCCFWQESGDANVSLSLIVSVSKSEQNAYVRAREKHVKDEYFAYNEYLYKKSAKG